ncbi:hypothetical protein A2264_04770 [candidate division WWE3 bacterium RIFOXYA2_FULL_46_9]|uniref:Uncharacterized protein n=1 Tax=candidate division WWE3 bacterium RIFOXYA2_FULL_46_9 TaxID=1802636 RepID=A0A1F4W2K1_UNCKA|nr:MAG: hypothetical protein A2264_04770 [candidate division WWE3 bacterium RIFOXYA2_FULL_46_9]OGC64720.1 MAG: hypothetical protein A2326_01625 [candidate division WWE3 bacterium RIFOXYB2_FULL_41_6]
MHWISYIREVWPGLLTAANVLRLPLDKISPEMLRTLQDAGTLYGVIIENRGILVWRAKERGKRKFGTKKFVVEYQAGDLLVATPSEVFPSVLARHTESERKLWFSYQELQGPIPADILGILVIKDLLSLRWEWHTAIETHPRLGLIVPQRYVIELSGQNGVTKLFPGSALIVSEQGLSGIPHRKMIDYSYHK